MNCEMNCYRFEFWDESDMRGYQMVVFAENIEKAWKAIEEAGCHPSPFFKNESVIATDIEFPFVMRA